MKIAVCVSGGGTNLQAIIDAIDNGTITNTQIEVVISNNADAYALERAKKAGIKAVCISPKNYESRAAFNEDFLKYLEDNYGHKTKSFELQLRKYNFDKKTQIYDRRFYITLIRA